MTSSRYQKAMILVKGGYAPDVIVVQHGKLMRLNFRCEETTACSEMVWLPDFDKSARLPTGDVVALEFLPDAPSEHEFACQIGMLRSKLVVE